MRLDQAMTYLVIWLNTQFENHFVVMFYNSSSHEHFGFKTRSLAQFSTNGKVVLENSCQLWRSIQDMVEHGLPSITVCSNEDFISDE